MLEWFTHAARAVVLDAQARARGEQADEVGEQHLLAALLATGTTAALLGQLGLSADVLADLGRDPETVRRPGEGKPGGPGSPANPQSTPQAGRRWWRGLPFSTGGKLALQAARQQAIARGDRELRPEHLLLGLLVRPGPLADALRTRGVTTATVLAALDGPGTAEGPTAEEPTS